MEQHESDTAMGMAAWPRRILMSIVENLTNQQREMCK